MFILIGLENNEHFDLLNFFIDFIEDLNSMKLFCNNIIRLKQDFGQNQTKIDLILLFWVQIH